MDDSLKFRVPEPSAESAPSAVVEKDFRGVACPMNFVKTKLALDTLNSGQQLKILIDDGEPIQNVPNSVALEGHKILSKTQNGSYWEVVIEKK
jgi:sulfite reductase (ferredoxin)